MVIFQLQGNQSMCLAGWYGSCKNTIPVVPARGWKLPQGYTIRQTFVIYRTCTRPYVSAARACVHCAKVHCSKCHRLETPHFILHSSHSTLHSSHCTLRTSHFTMHSSHSTLHTHTSHFRLHTSSQFIWALLTSSSLLISSHMSSKFFSADFISSEHCSTFLISSKLFLAHLSSSVRQKSCTVRDKLLDLYTLAVARRKLLHKETCRHMMCRHRCVYTEVFMRRKLLHLETFYAYTEKLFNRDPSTHRKNGNRFHKALPSTTSLAQITS